MQINKFKISVFATGKVKLLAQRTGLTPNLICRMAMVNSFEAGPITGPTKKSEEGQEFNAYTLFGDYQPIFIDMLRFVESKAIVVDCDDSALLRKLSQHIDRGVRYLYLRLKSPADVADLIAGSP